jgi:hypothetical protein
VKVALAACVLGAAALVFPVGQLAADHRGEQRFRREVAKELERLHAENGRLRSAVARGVPFPIRTLAVIAACESGGDPRAVSPGGRYRGAWQWDRGTWSSVGGRGDPVRASLAEQWARALLLFNARGTQPWPVCGSGL